MKAPRILATALLILYLAALIRPIWPYMEFAWNQDYIAEVLCINRDRPELACEGKCYLMQKIKAQEEQESREALPHNSLDNEMTVEHVASNSPMYLNPSLACIGLGDQESAIWQSLGLSPPTPPPQI